MIKLDLNNLKEKTLPILKYINHKWDDLTGNARNGHRDPVSSWYDLAQISTDGHLNDIDHENPYILYLPNDYIYPGGRFVVQFYWDSYFIILSLLRGNRFELAKGMVENCLFLVEKHGMVIANRKRWAAGSQLPFLAFMVKEIYHYCHDKEWLEKSVKALEKEYNKYWLDQNHLVHEGLSRYHAPPYFPKKHLAEITLDNEATWDMSPRYDADDILNLLPVDLNSNLFKYEVNLAFFYNQLGKKDKSHFWEDRANQREKNINALMWDEDDGLYYDYNFKLGERKKIKSLATFFPLFCKLANKNQGEKVKRNIALFEQDYGLTTCDKNYGYSDRQWNYPIGWAPLHWIAYKGLNNYGYNIDAERIALKWLSINFNTWKKTNKLFEKYDVLNATHDLSVDNRYNNQEGFGWTNAVFLLLTDDLLKKRELFNG